MTAQYFYRQLTKIHRSEQSDLVRLDSLHQLMVQMILLATEGEKIHFSTLFARMAYAFQSKNVNGRVAYALHNFRRKVERRQQGHTLEIPDEEVVRTGLKALADACEAFFGETIPRDVAAWLPQVYEMEVYRSTKKFLPVVRVVAMTDFPKAKQLLVRPEGNPGEPVRVRYDEPDRNEIFNKTIQYLRSVVQFPAVLNLIDVEVSEDGTWSPRAFILEPDYLVDVSAVASCYSGRHPQPLFYLLSKFLPYTKSIPLLTGDIANFFLDELMTNPEADFRETFPKVFLQNPLPFSLMEDKDILRIRKDSQRHWTSLKKVIKEDFASANIDHDHCYLEPTFYSERYGLQGRLDVLHRHEDRAAIVELKSGKPFNPGKDGITPSHKIQTLLYDLMIKSAFGNEVDPRNYILYSKLETEQLRYAPRIKQQQWEALQVRNEIVGLEYQLHQGNLPNPVFSRLRPDRFPRVKGFRANDLQLFAGTYENVSELERMYFGLFTGFVAREQLMAKTGAPNTERVNGLSALWRDTLRRKEERFAVFSHLTIQEKDVRSEEPTIVFRRDTGRDKLANFRRGDVVVLYPYDRADASVLSHQIFKCTIQEITPEQVTVQLRCRQFNEELFDRYELWNLEADIMDSGFRGLHRGLFGFLQSKEDKRRLLLGQRPPRKLKATEFKDGKIIVPTQPIEHKRIEVPQELTSEQQKVFRQIVLSEEYFLLWGPPGTGKTSMMLRHLVDYLVRQEGEEILLLAYTNRSVDEMCEALQNAGLDFLRIGSAHGTSPQYRDRLLQTKIQGVRRRAELREVVEAHRVVVSTVSSFNGKPELLQLKQFSRVIIDEASQILEPLLVGLLPKFPKFLLIGDHKQLPAVVQQSAEQSSVDYEPLRELGLTNLRNSLFERLFKRCQQEKWTWAYAQLSAQGRMHREVMDFPNRQFYGNSLKILPESIPHSLTQSAVLSFDQPEEASELECDLCSRRLLYLPTATDDNLNTKTNADEVRRLLDVLRSLQRVYQHNQLDLHAGSIGIITPFRAQIALIREALEGAGLNLPRITIDTVERYQGGARDIILLSLCTNSAEQLQQMISLSDEQVDRKLNVALTRARQQVVILGNRDVLNANSIYRNLLKSIERMLPVG